MSRAIPVLPLYAYMSCMGTTLPFYLFYDIKCLYWGSNQATTEHCYTNLLGSLCYWLHVYAVHINILYTRCGSSIL